MFVLSGQSMNGSTVSVNHSHLYYNIRSHSQRGNLNLCDNVFHYDLCSKLREALDKIYKIKAIRNEQRIQARYMDNWVEGEGPRKIMRRGVLMNLLQQAAATLPLFIPKLGER